MNFLTELIEIVDVIGVSKEVIVNALRANFKDFEDAVQYYTALTGDIDTIVTRNKPDFSTSLIPVYTPQELLAAL